jgi:lipopolysaccharide export system ATP-binding protein
LHAKIHTNGLVKVYKDRTVVNHVSFEVNQGEIVGLLGPNGAGKTTSFYMVVGFVKPNEGKVFLNQTEITGLPMYKRAQMGIGYLPQEASVFRKLSVEDNILAILEMTNRNKKEQRQKLEELLDMYGKVWVDCLVEGKGEELKLPGPWPRIQSLFYSMNRLPVSIRLQWKIYREL